MTMTFGLKALTGLLLVLLMPHIASHDQFKNEEPMAVRTYNVNASLIDPTRSNETFANNLNFDPRPGTYFFTYVYNPQSNRGFPPVPELRPLDRDRLPIDSRDDQSDDLLKRVKLEGALRPVTGSELIDRVRRNLLFLELLHVWDDETPTSHVEYCLAA